MWPTSIDVVDAQVAILQAQLDRVQAIASARLAEAQAEPGAGTMNAITVNELTRTFGDFVAVDRVSFDVRKGEVFGFLGSNGAGKSTTIRMLCGLLKPTERHGDSSDGVDVGRDPEGVKRRIGYMSQRFSLYEQLTVDQNIRFFGGIYGLSGATFEKRRAFVMEMAGLQGRETTRASDLAGGWRQRLALGCAILHEPPIVFLDEPTGGVDPVSRRQFWALIDQLAESRRHGARDDPLPRRGRALPSHRDHPRGPTCGTRLDDRAEAGLRRADHSRSAVRRPGAGDARARRHGRGGEDQRVRHRRARGDGRGRSHVPGCAEGRVSRRPECAARRIEPVEPSLEDVFLEVVAGAGFLMRKALSVGRKEVRQILRDRRSLVVLLFVPAFFLLVYGYALNWDIRHVRLAVEDRDRSSASRALVSAFVNSGYFDLVADIRSPEQITDLMNHGVRTGRRDHSSRACRATLPPAAPFRCRCCSMATTPTRRRR